MQLVEASITCTWLSMKNESMAADCTAVVCHCCLQKVSKRLALQRLALHVSFSDFHCSRKEPSRQLVTGGMRLQ